MTNGCTAELFEESGVGKGAAMSSVGRVMAVVMLAAGLMWLPGSAAAGEPELVDQRVETVTGAEIVSDLMASIEEIDLGSAGATVTVATADGPHELSVDLSDASAGSSDDGRGLWGLAALGGMAAAVMRGAAALLRAIRG